MKNRTKTIDSSSEVFLADSAVPKVALGKIPHGTCHNIASSEGTTFGGWWWQDAIDDAGKHATQKVFDSPML
jgi:hypothetical protein